MAKKGTVNPILAFVEAAKNTEAHPFGYRKGMAYAHYNAEKLRFEATDGKQLRYVIFADAETALLHGFAETGYYKSFGSKYVQDTDVQVQYPQVDRVIPDISEYQTYKLYAPDSEIAPMRLCAVTGLIFQYQHIAPLAKIWSKSSSIGGWTMHYSDKDKAVMFIADMIGEGMKLYAVVAPIVIRD